MNKVAYAYNPSISRQRGEVSEFKVSLSYILRHCFKQE